MGIRSEMNTLEGHRMPNLRWKDACKRDRKEAGLTEGNAKTRQNGGRS